MEPNLKDILAHLKTTPDQEALVRYLQDKMSDPDRHAVESQMNDDAFLDDAMEGLAELKSKEDIREIVFQLNLELQKQMHTKKKRHRIKKIPKQTWTIYAIIIIVLVCLIAFSLIKILMR